MCAVLLLDSVCLHMAKACNSPTFPQLYFEDEERAEMYELNLKHTLLQVLQHQR